MYGVPPQGRADYAFFQHILKSMHPETGRCAILFPHGVLFRDEEQQMRSRIVDADLIECVLGLGPNLFYNSPMEACVVVCRTCKPLERRNKVLFVNAVGQVTRERAQSFLTPAHQQKILDAYRAFADSDGFTRVTTLDEIRTNGSNLSIPLYVRGSSNGAATNGQSDLASTITAWQESSRALRESMQELFRLIEGSGEKQALTP